MISPSYLNNSKSHLMFCCKTNRHVITDLHHIHAISRALCGSTWHYWQLATRSLFRMQCQLRLVTPLRLMNGLHNRCLVGGLHGLAEACMCLFFWQLPARGKTCPQSPLPKTNQHSCPHTWSSLNWGLPYQQWTSGVMRWLDALQCQPEHWQRCSSIWLRFGQLCTNAFDSPVCEPHWTASMLLQVLVPGYKITQSIWKHQPERSVALRYRICPLPELVCPIDGCCKILPWCCHVTSPQSHIFSVLLFSGFSTHPSQPFCCQSCQLL